MMNNLWFCSDWHFGETRLEIMQRPFKTTEEHDEALIANHNSLVAPDDSVIIAGDCVYNKDCLPIISRMNGHKTLIRGNKERGIEDAELLKYFDKIIPEGDGIYYNYQPLDGTAVIPCFITHYPTKGQKDYFNLSGHIHSAWKYQLNALNISVDVHHFRPMNSNMIPFFLKAICNFYDQDVWVAYQDYNSQFVGKRGRKGSYLDSMEK